jgi:hypothetical protein
MQRLEAVTCALFLLTIAPPVCASQSVPNGPSRRDSIRLKVQIRNTTLPATVRLRFLSGAKSLSGVSRVVSVPYETTFDAQQLRLRVEPTDPGASVMVAVERWRDGALEEEGNVTGKGILVQVQRDVLGLIAGPLDLHVF